MILTIKKSDNSVETYKIYEPEDLLELAEQYPFVESAINNSADLKEAVHKVADYLNRSHLEATVEEGLTKSIRAKAATLGLIAGLMAHGGTKQVSSMAGIVPPGKLTAPAQEKFGKKGVDNFLWSIMQIETAGGKRLDHPVIQTGPMKGQQAVGRWALLQPTVVDFSKRLAAQGLLTPDMQRASELDRDRLHDFFIKHPYTELKFARAMASHVMDKHGGDNQKAAYSWLHGHNIHTDDISQDMLHSSDYVNKFNKYHSKAPFKVAKPALVAKADRAPHKTHYKQRFSTWKQKQDQRKRNNFSYKKDNNDHGRIREPELDQVGKKSDNAIERLKQGLKTK